MAYYDSRVTSHLNGHFSHRYRAIKYNETSNQTLNITALYQTTLSYDFFTRNDKYTYDSILCTMILNSFPCCNATVADEYFSRSFKQFNS